MNMLLDQTLKLKAEAHSPIHIQELRRLVMLIVTETSTTSNSTILPSPAESEAPEEVEGSSNNVSTTIPYTTYTEPHAADIEASDTDLNSDIISQVKSQNTLEIKPTLTQKQHNNEQLLMKLEKLLTRMTYAVDSDSNIWDVYAVYHQCFDRGVQAKDCRVKQVGSMFIYCIVYIVESLYTIYISHKHITYLCTH